MKRNNGNAPHATSIQQKSKSKLKGLKKSEEHKRAISDGLKDFHAKKSKKKWIRGAVDNPGSLRRAAKRAGLIKDKEKLSDGDLKTLETKGSKLTKKRAKLAETLKQIREKTNGIRN